VRKKKSRKKKKKSKRNESGAENEGKFVTCSARIPKNNLRHVSGRDARMSADDRMAMGRKP